MLLLFPMSNSSASAEHMSYSEMMEHAAVFLEGVDALFPRLLVHGQSNPAMSVSMKHNFQKLTAVTYDRAEVAHHIQAYPRQRMSGHRTIVADVPYSRGWLRVMQHDKPQFIMPCYETTLFNPPVRSNPLDDLEREMGPLRYIRDGIELQFKTPLMYSSERSADISFVNFFPAQPEDMQREPGFQGNTISVSLGDPDALKHIYSKERLPRLSETDETVLAARGIYGLLASQLDYMLQVIDEAGCE